MKKNPQQNNNIRFTAILCACILFLGGFAGSSRAQADGATNDTAYAAANASDAQTPYDSFLLPFGVNPNSNIQIQVTDPLPSSIALPAQSNTPQIIFQFPQIPQNPQSVPIPQNSCLQTAHPNPILLGFNFWNSTSGLNGISSDPTGSAACLILNVSYEGGEPHQQIAFVTNHPRTYTLTVNTTPSLAYDPAFEQGTVPAAAPAINQRTDTSYSKHFALTASVSACTARSIAILSTNTSPNQRNQELRC